VIDTVDNDMADTLEGASQCDTGDDLPIIYELYRFSDCLISENSL